MGRVASETSHTVSSSSPGPERTTCWWQLTLWPTSNCPIGYSIRLPVVFLRRADTVLSTENRKRMHYQKSVVVLLGADREKEERKTSTHHCIYRTYSDWRRSPRFQVRRIERDVHQELKMFPSTLEDFLFRIFAWTGTRNWLMATLCSLPDLIASQGLLALLYIPPSWQFPKSHFAFYF